MRDEAAISRLYGGIHYRADIEVGKQHGARIGSYTVSVRPQRRSGLSPSTAPTPERPVCCA